MEFLNKLREANIERQKIWDPDNKITPEFRGLELGGEAGEAQNQVKKLVRERLGLRGSKGSIELLTEELADVIICTDLIAMDFGIDLKQAVINKFNTTSKERNLDVHL